MMLLYVCAFTTGVQKGEAEGEGEGEGEEEGRRLAYTKGTYLVVRIWLHFSWTPKSEAPNLDLSSFFSPCFVRLDITDTSLISYLRIILGLNIAMRLLKILKFIITNQHSAPGHDWNQSFIYLFIHI